MSVSYEFWRIIIDVNHFHNKSDPVVKTRVVYEKRKQMTSINAQLTVGGTIALWNNI